MLSRLGFKRFIDKWHITPGEQTELFEVTGNTAELETVELQPEELMRRVREAAYIALTHGEELSELTLSDGKGIYEISQLKAQDAWDDIVTLIFSKDVRKVSPRGKGFHEPGAVRQY